MAAKVLEKIQLEIKDTLEALGYVDVVSMSSKGSDIRFLCRVNNEPKWLKTLYGILTEERDYYLFVGKKYFISSGNLLYGWVIVLESESIDKTSRDFRKLVLSSNGDVTNEEESSKKEPESYVVPLPFSSGYGEKLQGRVKPVR